MTSLYNQQSQVQMTSFKGINKISQYLLLAWALYNLSCLAPLIQVLWAHSYHPCIPHSQIWPILHACRAFPDDQGISTNVAYTTVTAGSPSPSRVWLDILIQSSPMHLFACVTTSRQVTTINHILQMTTRMGQPNTQWDEQNCAMDMGWADMGGQDCGNQPICFTKPFLRLCQS